MPPYTFTRNFKTKVDTIETFYFELEGARAPTTGGGWLVGASQYRVRHANETEWNVRPLKEMPPERMPNLGELETQIAKEYAAFRGFELVE
jgi:hypothetical protein